MGGQGSVEILHSLERRTNQILAKQVKHPFDSPPAMPDTVLEAALQIAVGGPTAVAVNLVGQIEAWRLQAAELQAAERHRRAKAFR